jgi:KaiC/GvpD/RAD55 family RecA-like ATPase
MAERDLVRTGISGLDDLLSGGIPRGNVILLEGAIGSGKTTTGVEFIYRGASEFDEPGIIVVFEVSPEKVVRDAAHFGWDLEGLERRNKLKIIFTTRAIFRQELQQADSLLLEEAAKMGARRIFVDGVAGVIGASPGQEPRDAFHVLVEGLYRENLTGILAVEASALEGNGLGARPEESIADTVIRLKVEDVSRAAVRSLEIVKSRGEDFQMGRHSFRIIDGHGIQVYRRVQSPRRSKRDRAAAFDPTTRISTGIPGLDAITNGGYFLGSTTVVAGISGVGKSVMALQYIAEGARRGERSLMLSLDEQVPQILRNAQTVGIDLQASIDRKLVRVEYAPPQEIEVDQHFHHIEGLVEEFRPRRVVIDSLSNAAEAFGARHRTRAGQAAGRDAGWQRGHRERRARPRHRSHRTVADAHAGERCCFRRACGRHRRVARARAPDDPAGRGHGRGARADAVAARAARRAGAGGREWIAGARDAGRSPRGYRAVRPANADHGRIRIHGRVDTGRLQSPARRRALGPREQRRSRQDPGRGIQGASRQAVRLRDARHDRAHVTRSARVGLIEELGEPP